MKVIQFPKLRWFIVSGAILGGLVPLVFLILDAFFHYLATERDLILWPASIMLMETETHDHDLFAQSILACSILLNVLCYSLFAAFLWCIGRVFTAVFSWMRTR